MNRTLPTFVSAAQKISLSIARRKPAMERIRVAKINRGEAVTELERTPSGEGAPVNRETLAFSWTTYPG